MSRRLLFLAVPLLSLLVTPACFGPDPDLTSAGKGKPEVEVTFPETVEIGDVVTATVTVSNPGPEAMKEVVVVFSRLGNPRLPYPIVELVPGRGSVGVEGVDPEPPTPSADGITFRYPGLDEGESTTIEFRLKIPDHEGAVGNAVQVYDSADPERARGVPLEAQASR